jgi:hypothetical protein
VALLVTGFLMLLERVGVMNANFFGFDLNMIYALIVLISVPILFLYKKLIGKIL